MNPQLKETFELKLSSNNLISSFVRFSYESKIVLKNCKETYMLSNLSPLFLPILSISSIIEFLTSREVSKANSLLKDFKSEIKKEFEFY